MCAEWDLLASDFLSEYGVRLRTADLSWREFLTYLTGLLACDSRVSRRFAKTNDEEPDGEW